MALEQKITQKQSLTMSQQLRQAIELLELSHLDLQSFVEAQALENPFLEVEGKSMEKGLSSLENLKSSANSALSAERENNGASQSSYRNASEVWVGDRGGQTRLGEDFDAKKRIEAIEDRPLNLREHLLSQINTDLHSEKDRMLAAQLVDELHETGYFLTPLSDLQARLGVCEKELKALLDRLKGLDPAGIFATSLQECLELQLEERGLLTSPVKKLLEHLHLYADAKVEELMRLTSMEAVELKQVLDMLRTLNPKPGLTYQDVQQPLIIPDIIIEENTLEIDHLDQGIDHDLFDESGARFEFNGQENHQSQATTPDVKLEAPTVSWNVRLNAETLPRVLINQEYRTKYQSKGQKDSELKSYYQKNIAAANWLIRALDQRATNTLKVARSILSKQEAFFTQGLSALKPLTLRQVAEETGLHESTVSRITQNKYLMCSRGTFELRYFFNASITNAWTGEDQSAMKIQHAISELIRREDPANPLSDDALVRALTEKNLDVARRTVAKYRELMKIPSSYERKKRHKNDIALQKLA